MENKTSKYFKYAIGEIILVVIGILIALSINNWNESRKLNIKETIYLKGLKADFEQTKVALNRVIEKTGRVNETVDTLVSMMRNIGEELTLFQIDSLTHVSTGFTVLMPSEGVINDIIGSGKLDMIKNNELRTKIASWEANLKMIRENEKLSKAVSIKFSDHTSQYFNIVNGKFGEAAFLNHRRSDFLNDNIMSNYMADIFGHSLKLNNLYKDKLKEIDNLITIVNNELE